jgi:hypothetical protein
LTSGANTSILTTTPTGLDVADSITVPSQTYPLTSSNQVATISYVNQVANQIVFGKIHEKSINCIEIKEFIL